MEEGNLSQLQCIQKRHVKVKARKLTVSQFPRFFTPESLFLSAENIKTQTCESFIYLHFLRIGSFGWKIEEPRTGKANGGMKKRE